MTAAKKMTGAEYRRLTRRQRATFVLRATERANEMQQEVMRKAMEQRR